MIKPVIQFSNFSGVIILRYFIDHHFQNMSTMSPTTKCSGEGLLSQPMGGQKIEMENWQLYAAFIQWSGDNNLLSRADPPTASCTGLHQMKHEVR